MPPPLTAASLSLCTFGYEGLDIETFVARLKQVRVRAIVDVRELPLSRKRGFSKTAFARTLQGAGIGYSHVLALGCPRPIRDRYRRDNDWTAYTRAFLSHLRSQRATVRDLAAFARTMMVCLVCFEADYTLCHRTYVARAARLAGAPEIQHLTARTALLDESRPRSASADIARSR
jgi:uncharacterized protein (DUF488 family)